MATKYYVAVRYFLPEKRSCCLASLMKTKSTFVATDFRQYTLASVATNENIAESYC